MPPTEVVLRNGVAGGWVWMDQDRTKSWSESDPQLGVMLRDEESTQPGDFVCTLDPETMVMSPFIEVSSDVESSTTPPATQLQEDVTSDEDTRGGEHHIEIFTDETLEDAISNADILESAPHCSEDSQDAEDERRPSLELPPNPSSDSTEHRRPSNELPPHPCELPPEPLKSRSLDRAE